MLNNVSKMSQSMICWKKAFNSFLRGFKSEPSWGLLDGTAFHRGLAEGMSKKDWDAAIKLAKAQFDKESESKVVLPGDQFLQEEHWNVVEKMIRCYEENWAPEEYTVLQPEVRFAVNLPNTEHCDPFIHWLEYMPETDLWEERWNHYRFVADDPVDIKDKQPELFDDDGNRKIFYYNGTRYTYKNDRLDPEKILSRMIRSPHDASLGCYLKMGAEACPKDQKCLCYQPHQLRGIVDALVLWHGVPWFHEHKSTTSMSPVFWTDFQLDIQITAYTYGIWKSTGLRPRGAIINAVSKPNENMVAAWNKKRTYGPKKTMADYISYGREPILRTEEQVQAFERQAIENCNEWVTRLLNGSFGMSNTRGICTMWFRPCDYHSLCCSSDAEHEVKAFEEQRLLQIEQRRSSR